MRNMFFTTSEARIVAASVTLGLLLSSYMRIPRTGESGMRNQESGGGCPNSKPNYCLLLPTLCCISTYINTSKQYPRYWENYPYPSQYFFFDATTPYVPAPLPPPKGEKTMIYAIFPVRDFFKKKTH